MARMMKNTANKPGYLYWINLALNAESAEAAFTFAQDHQEELPAIAYELYKTAFKDGHIGATWALANLCRSQSAETLNTTQEELDEILSESLEIGDQLMTQEAFDALVTGSHPVQFLDEHCIPWGSGTFFIAAWKGHQFAITAKHVIEECNADPKNARLLVTGHENPVPFLGCFTPKHDEIEESDDSQDIFLWLVDDSPIGPKVEWWSWRMDILWKPSSSLKSGQKIFAVGYPNTDSKYDYENRKIIPQALVVRGELSGDSIIDGLFTIDCADFSVDIDGISGGPIFAMFGGVFYFVGMALRGGASAKKIHFLGAEHVINTLDQALAEAQTEKVIPSQSASTCS